MPYMWSPSGERVWIESARVGVYEAEGYTLVNPTPAPPTPATPTPATPWRGRTAPEEETPWPVGPSGPTTMIPGTAGENRFVYLIDGKYYLVYNVPVDSDGDGQFDETVPIAYETTAQDLVDHGLLDRTGGITALVGNHRYSADEWAQMGGLVLGNINELNNPDDDPMEFLVSQMIDQANLYPWLLDPEIMAMTAGAWLEGRSLTEGELAGTDWWQTHTEAERNWLSMAAQSPGAAEELLRDNRIMVLEMLQTAGVNNAPDVLVNLLADNFTRGTWSQIYLGNQVDLLSDPAKRGDLDDELTSYFDQHAGFTLDTTQKYQDTVRDTVRKWLGPTFGEWDDTQIDRWAAKLRNDPDAKQRLDGMLSRQRMAMYSAYTDPTATYDDISGPWRNYVTQVWGQQPDETDEFFTKILQVNDMTEASRMLREEGVKRGVGKVTDDMLAALSESFSGGGIVRAL